MENDCQNKYRAQKELSDAGIENLEDGISKEKEIEEKRWADELALLKKRLNDKKDLKDEEVLLNEAIDAIIVQKQKTHDKKIADLNNADVAQKQMAAAEISGKDKQKWEAERTLARTQYLQELKDSKGQSNKVQKAEKKLSDQLLKIKMEELIARQTIGDKVFEGADNIFGGLAELAGKETALGKAAFLFQPAAAIGQIIFNTAIANSKAAALFPLTGGMPWVGINTAAAAISIALVVKQAISSAKTSQKAEGSYPVIGADDGKLYHASEGGNPQTGVYSRPTLLNMSDGRSLVGERAPELVVDGDTFRRIQLNAPEILRDIYAYAGKGPGRSKQKASGSYQETGSWQNGAARPGTDRGSEGENEKMISAINRLNTQLEKGIRASINKYGRNGLSDSMNEIAKFNKKVFKK